MKNLALTFIIAFIAISTINAQRSQKKAKTFTDRNLYELTAELNNLANTTQSTDEKDKLTIKLIRNYLMTSEADVIMSVPSCGNNNTRNYIKQMKNQKFDRVPASYITKNGKVNNTCEFNQAVEIYNMVGHELVTSDNLCGIMGCDDIEVAKRPKKMAPISTSKRPQWKYAGVRRYFIEKEKFGWRYLCIDNNVSGKVILSDKIVRQAIVELESSIALAEESGRSMDKSMIPTSIKKYNLSWKLENQVDIW